MSALRRLADAMRRSALNDGVKQPAPMETFGAIVALVDESSRGALRHLQEVAFQNGGEVSNEDVWHYLLRIFLACELASENMERLDAAGLGFDPKSN